MEQLASQIQLGSPAAVTSMATTQISLFNTTEVKEVYRHTRLHIRVYTSRTAVHMDVHIYNIDMDECVHLIVRMEEVFH